MSDALRELLARVEAADIRLWVDDGRLRYDAPEGAMTPELAAALREHRAELIDHLRLRDDAVSRAEHPPIRPRTAADGAPLSFAQQRLWFLDQLGTGPAYNVPLVKRLSGALDVTALEAALRAIVERHEVLRTSFPSENGQPVQRIAPTPELPFESVDLRHLEPNEREPRVHQLIDEDVLCLFDLEHGPLMRCRLYRLDDDDYVFVLAFHHVIIDAWSIGLFQRELSELYRALRAGEAPRLRELPVQYADFSIWQRKWMQGETLEAQLEYWRDQLGPEVPVVELPLDRVRPRVQSFAAADHRFQIPSNVMSALETLGGRQGATPAMTLLAAFNMLLAQYAGQDDVVVGMPVANRGDIAVEDLIGFFVNTLAIRTDLSGNPTFTELLARVREASAGAYDHQDVPFDLLVDDLKPERDPSRNPLFQVMCVVQRVSGEDLVLPGIDVRPFERSVAVTRFDLEVHMDVDEGGLHGRFIYKTDLFDDATVTRMAGRFRMLLEAIAANHEVRRSELPWLTDEEREQVVVAWNRTDRELAPGVCVHELFEAQVQRTPDAAALEFEGTTLSYRELNERANRVARHLRSRGAGPDHPIGICVERSIEMVVGVLGVLKAGAGYLPLDPSYPEDRLAYMVDNARAKIVLTQTSLRSKIDALGGGTDRIDVVDLHGDRSTIAQQPADDFDMPVDPGDLAYAIYTSGSTGRPKGVAMPHRPLVNLVQWHKETLVDGAEVRTVQFAPFSFDVSFQEIFTTLGVGGTLILISEDLRRDAAALLSLLRDRSVTRLFAPFVALRQLADVAQEVSELPASLCDVITAGEQLQVTPALVALFKRLPGCRLHNHYGPSETHLVTALTLDGSPETWPALPAIGRPIANTRIYLLDEHGQPVPIGVPGELYIGGTVVSDGYLHAPDLTAERFVPDPFDATSAGRLYRTGDRARYLSDGTIEFLGRVDHQVKLRGYRIEPAEIESQLTEHADVRQAIAMVREERGGHRRLVSYVVGTPGRVPSPAELKSWMKGRVPEYMVPAAFVTLDAFPLTPSGKVDRRKLPALDGATLGVGTEYVAPRDGTEEILCAIWADVLGVEHVGVHDDFFDLGGHSLLATQVVSRIRQVLEVELPLQALFDEPTIERLAAIVQGAGANAPDAAPIVPLPRDGDLPLSFAQQRLWFLDALYEGSAGYNLPIALRIHGELDRSALQRSLDEHVARHETLRTSFRSSNGVPRQSIAAPAPTVMRLVDVADCPADTREAAVQQIVQEEISQRFDLSAGRLVRPVLVRLADDEHLLLLTFHHIVTDGWSFGVLKRELRALYAAFTQGKPSPLPPLAIQYADYGAWQRERLAGSLGDEQLRYWKSQLAELSPLELPTDRRRPAKQTFRAGSTQLVLSKDSSQAIKTVSRASGATAFMTLLAAFAALLRRYTGQDDIVVGTPIANRNHVDIEPLVGFFVNTLVLRTDLAGDPTIRELIARVRRTALDAFQHQDIPFEHLVEELHPERDLARSPLFQVLFALRNEDAESIDLPGLETSNYPIEVRSTRFDLELWVRESDDQLVASFIYNADLFDATTIERMAQHYRRLLEGAVSDPDRAVGALPLLDPAEHRRLVSEWNDTEAALPEAACLHELFERQVARTPDATAIVDGERSVTFADLDARANALGHRLRELGVGPEVPVGIHLGRGADMITAILATLKAGGTYLPLDPAYPHERIQYMLEDARATVVVAARAQADDLGGLVGGERDDAAPTIVFVDDELPAVSSTGAITESGVRPGHVAYIIYTSGSTGRPKGVAITHDNAAALVHWARMVYDEADLRGVLAATSICFDLSVFEMFVPLSWGGSIIVAENAVALPTLPARDRVTLINTVPSAMAELVRQDALPPSLRTVNLAGEPLSPHLVDAIYDKGVDRVFDLYGPSEDTTYTTGALRERGGPATIGRPLDNEQVYLLDERGVPVPVGVVGELYAGGRGVARGYVNDPVLTAAKFVPDPFSGVAGGRLYRTGDLGRYRADGNIEFLGRADHQVKLRGFRIELGEIETCLRRNTAVQDVLVLVRTDARGDQHLTAFVAGAGANERDLRAFVAEHLPSYMVPTGFVLLDAMPLLPNGKIDRKALVGLTPTVSAVAEDHVAPRGPREEAIAALFAELLELDKVSVHDGFFDLGGHSLLGTQLIARLRKVLEVDLALSDLFEAPTVAGLAARLESGHDTDGTRATTIGILARDGSELPLSFAEERLWFLDQMGAGAGYNMPMAIRARGALDIAALEQSIATIAQRHETLRTSFPVVEGRPRISIADRFEVPLEVIDRTGLSDAERDAEINRLATSEAHVPFDLDRGPLLRAKLIQLAEDDHVLVVTFHHIVSDGWSASVFARELMACYDGFVQGHEPRVAALPVQYVDYAAWQRSWLRGDELDRQFGYWEEELRDLPVLSLPTDRPRPTVASFAGDSIRFELSPELVTAVHDLGRREGVTPAMLLLGAFQVLLARYSGQDDVAVGSPIANRVHPDVENLIGFFVNTLVLRTKLSGDPTFVEVLRRVRKASLGAYDHQDLPFERLVDKLEPERDMSRNPLFQVAFMLQNMPRVEIELPGLALEQAPLDFQTVRVDLELYLQETDGRISGRAMYSTDLFDAATIAQMLRHYVRLLEDAVAAPDTRISALALLEDDERRRLLDTWNETQAPFADDRCIHELFEARVVEAPEATAVVAGGTTLTYGELNARANQLAHGLRARGVGPDTLVGVCIERSADMIVGLLGIQKAGGAYVPLDPTYPRERLAYMLEDSGVRVLLTQAPLLEALPPYDGETVCLDRDWPLFESESTADPVLVTSPDNLAYAIYTSGSTGRPKGTLLAHRGLVSLSAEQGRAFGAGPGSRVLQFSSLSFDACTFEITMALPKGGTLFLGDRQELMPGPDLLQFIRRHEISIVTLPPTALAALPVEPLPSLRTITVAGEACSSDLVSRWAPGRQFFNLYGPTEATIWSTTAGLHAGETAHIGRPNGNVRVYVLDAHGQPVPVGVPGELHVGGISVARGYLDRPALTAERFEPDPFGPVAGGRLYRTGDLVRYRADGNVEFLGRIDEQVKLRGYRIELGEIESVLDEHPAVLESVALVREDIKDDRRLVAYVKCDESVELVTPDTDAAAWQDDHVAHWQTLYDQSYADNQEPAEAAFNIAGWNSSYTGEPIPPEQMREWVNNTVARIRSTGPEHVLEMGCGSGLLLLNTVPHVAEYVGADFSQPALDYVAKQLSRMGDDGAKGRVECRTADNFEGLPKGHFDTVVLNSVVQYFPDADYLRRVLEGAVATVRPGGRVFVGDVRSLPLLRAFHASVQLEQAPIETTREQLERRVHHEMNQDQELVIDPSFFMTLAADIDGISHVEMEPKRGRYDNELSRFRYDVIVHVAGGAPNGSMAELDWRSWNDAGMTLARLRTALAEAQPTSLALAEVPNRRVARDVEIAAMLDDPDAPARVDTIRFALNARADDAPGVEPDDLRHLAEDLGYDVYASFAAARSDGSYDVVLARRADGVPPEGIWRAMPVPSADREQSAEPTNRPLRGRFLRELVPQLREHATARLPEYMVPSVFTVMDRLPLTPNGKVDRRALPAPDALRPELAVAYEAPRSALEETLARVWVQVLGVDRVGAHDNFFELGGDSMLSIQVVAMAREAGIGISARDLFQLQTVAELAAAAGSAVATAEQGVVTGDVPLTPIMRWFFEQDLADASHFNQAFMIAADTPFDASEVEEVLGQLAIHHDALRLRARRGDEGWTLTLVEPGDRVPVEVVDLSTVAAAEQPAFMECEATRVQASLDLENGPLVRCAIFRGGASDDGRSERLLIVIHHLAVDVVSWGVLLDHLARAIKQRRASQPLSLPPKTTSIREWAIRLDEHAQSDEVAASAAYWLDRPWSKASSFPVDHAHGPSTIESVRTVPAHLDEEQTRAVLHEVPAAYNATVEDVLLAALAIACAAETKGEFTLIDLEGHGRDEFADDLDITRTVGWFTSIHPVLLHAESGAGAGAVMRSVKEQLRAVPGNGLAFGLARYTARDVELADRMRAVPDAPIAFNYLGRIDQMTNRDDEWSVSTRGVGESRGPRGVRKHVLEISGGVSQDQLRLSFAYSSAVHEEATIKRLADRYIAALGELIESSRSGDDRGYTASDLAEVGWNVEDVTDLLSDLEGNL